MDKIIFLEPVFCERIWGGRNLEKFNFSIPQGNIGAAWVIAAHDNGSSKIINGQLAGLTLKEAYEKAKRSLVANVVVDADAARQPSTVPHDDQPADGLFRAQPGRLILPAASVHALAPLGFLPQ